MGSASVTPFVLSLKARFAALDRRERLFLGAGAIALLAFLIYVLAPADAEPEIELADAPVAVAPVPAVPPPPPPSTTPPSAPAASVSGLVLRGVLGGGAAIIAFPDGGERVVRVGRAALPGIVLKEVALHHVILATASGDTRLEFNKAATAVQAAPSSPLDASRAGRAGRETIEFRTGLAPRLENGRIAGFAVRPGAKLEILERAGLRAGDMIVAVNGQAFRTEEKVLELSDELASSYTAEIEFLRGGRRLKGTLEVNKRPGQ